MLELILVQEGQDDLWWIVCSERKKVHVGSEPRKKSVCVCVFRAELSHECAEARGSHRYLPLLTSVLFFEIGFLQ